jgi:cytoskeleton protein RodZ
MDIGARLRHARESRGLTIEALSRSTRVQPRILSAIEQNDSVTIPPRPYGRGFVRAYASEVGLDPDGTVKEFFSQFGPAEPPLHTPERTVPHEPRPERWFWPVAAVLGYAAIGAFVIIAGRWMTQGAGEVGAVGTSGTAVPAPAAAEHRQPAPVPPPTPSGVAVVLEAHRPVWVTATVDGRRTVYRTLQPGERVNLVGAQEAAIRTGDAGGLSWAVNGRPAVLMGASGEVKTVRVVPEDAVVK